MRHRHRPPSGPVPTLGAVRGALLAQLHQVAHAAFVPRAPRLDALPQPGLFLLELLVEPLELARLGVERVGLLLEVQRVAPRPRRQAAAIELDDARRQRREERAIVRHEEQRAGEAVAGSPRASGSRRCRDGWSARRAAAGRARTTSAFPSSARRRQPPESSRIGLSAGSDEPRDDELDFLLEPPAVALLELVLQVAQPRERAGVSPFGDLHRRVVIRGDQRAERPETVGDLVEDQALPGRGIRVSRPYVDTSCSSRATRSPGARQIVPASGGISPEITFSRLDFPDPLRADEGDALARLDAKIRRLEQRQMAERERDRGRASGVPQVG